jgi:soluble lytic murein transglycosylase-like protein
VTSFRLALIVPAVALMLAPSAASADIVRLTNGATLSVKSATADGDTMVLQLRGGGEMRTPTSLVAGVSPDEVLHADASTTFVLPAYEPPKPSASSVPDMIDRLAAQFGVPAKLAHALIRVESNYQPDAVSPKGAMGLMQLMPALAKYYAVADPFDPEQNLTAGLQHLRTLLDRFGDDTATALAAYNAGEPAVAKYGKIPPYRETQDYVRRIMSLVKSR